MVCTCLVSAGADSLTPVIVSVSVCLCQYSRSAAGSDGVCMSVCLFVCQADEALVRSMVTVSVCLVI